jgi:hypothetical protein
MKYPKITALLLIVLIGVLCSCFYHLGGQAKTKEIETRYIDRMYYHDEHFYSDESLEVMEYIVNGKNDF